MFQTLFRYPAIVARHRGGPFTEARERFLNFRAGQGLARTTLQRYAQERLVVAERIDITSDNAIGSSTIEAAADRWAREQQQRQRVHGPRWSRELFVQTATDWLCFLGHLEAPKANIVPFADRIADFAAYRRDERGLSPATIHNQSWHVEKFLGWLADQNRTLPISPWKMPFWPMAESEGGAGYRWLPAPKRCELSFNMRQYAAGVRVVSLPA